MKRVSTRRENREISGNFRLAATSQHGGLARSSSTIVFSFFPFFFSSPLPSFFPSSSSLPIRVSIDHGSRHVTTRLEFQYSARRKISLIYLISRTLRLLRPDKYYNDYKAKVPEHRQDNRTFFTSRFQIIKKAWQKFSSLVAP